MQSVVARLALVILFLLPGQGIGAIIDREWCRYGSEHFDLITDLPESKARSLIAKLERFRVAADSVMSSPAPATELPLKSLVFERGKDFKKVFKTRAFAGFMRPSLTENRLILGPDRDGKHLQENAFHEYAHHLLRNRRLANYPLWYEEGFASFLSAMSFDDRAILVGENAKHRSVYHRSSTDLDGFRVAEIYSSSRIGQRPIPVAELFQLANLNQWPRANIGSFYERSWLAVHLFRLGHLGGFEDRRDQLDRYLELVSHGVAAEAAFQQGFDLTYASLEWQLRRYSNMLRLPILDLPFPAMPAPRIASNGCMDSTDVAFELGVASVDWNLAYATKLFDTMLSADYEDPRAHIGKSIVSRSRGKISEAQAHAARAVELDVRNVWARVQLADTLLDTCANSTHSECTPDWERIIELYQTALALQPDRVDALFGLGVTRLFTGYSEQAVVYLQRVYEHAPWAPRINLYLGEAYRLAGDAVNAQFYLTRAYQSESTKIWRDKARQALALLVLQ